MTTLWKRKSKRPLLFLISLLSASFAINSCVINDPKIPETLLGRWQIEKIDAYLDERSAPGIDKSQNYEGKELYFEFLKNSKFATNTDLSLNKILLESDKALVGDFEYQNVKGKDLLKLTFTDKQYQETVELNFEIKDLQSEFPTLFMNKANYVASLKKSADNLPQILRANLYAFSLRINEARFSLTFKKI